MARDVNEYTRKNNWNSKHYDTINIVIKREEDGTSLQKARLKKLAVDSGRSVSRYIIDAINAYAGENILSPLDDESKKRKPKVEG